MKSRTTQTQNSRDHIALAAQYIEDVLSGKIEACLLVKAACLRQKNDLVRLSNHPVYVWRPEEGARACRYLERLPHIKGPKANKKELCVLEPWQCFVIVVAFGWRRKDNGARRFRRVYIEVPRGNGKSFKSAGIGLFCMSSDNEEGADVYSAATTRDQAKIVWGDAKAMLEKRPEFASKLGITVAQHSIFKKASNSKFLPLSREADNQDGLNVYCAVIDELHAHKTRETYDVIETATAKRDNSLIWVITTAGSDTSGICYEVRSYVKKVLEGLEDDTQFGIIYTIDDNDDWTDPKVWMKANPNWNVSVIPEVFTSLAFKAMQTPSAQNNFKTKHLNVWVNADAAAFDMRAWDKCTDFNLKIEDFAGQECYEGIDLASRIDICAKSRLFYKDVPVANPRPPTMMEALAGLAGNPQNEGKTVRHYYLFTECFLPETAVSDGRNSQYSGWEIQGWLKTTPGDTLDYAVVKDGVRQDSKDFIVREVGYDPWQAAQMAQELVEEGIVMVEVRPSTGSFSAPMKEFDALMREGRLHHDGNPIMRWMVSNVVCHTDAKDNVFPRKEKPENKIDGVVSALTALNRAMAATPAEPVPRIRVLGRRRS